MILPQWTRIGSVWAIEYGRSDGLWLLNTGYKRDYNFPLLLLNWSPGQARSHVLKTFKQASGEVYMRRNWGHQANTILLTLEVGPPVLVKPLDDFNPANIWQQLQERPSKDCPAKLSWIPDQQKLWAIKMTATV